MIFSPRRNCRNFLQDFRVQQAPLLQRQRLHRTPVRALDVVRQRVVSLRRRLLRLLGEELRGELPQVFERILKFIK